MPTTCVDRGGTFTDVVIFHDDGRIEARKVRSDEAVIGRLILGTCTVGSTVATNAILEGRGEPTLVLVPPGFGDVLEIGDMRRPSLFVPEARPGAPLATRVEEWTEAGIPEGLDGHAFSAAVVAALGADGAREEALAADLRRRFPHLQVVCATTSDPAVGFLARLETATVDAAITPILRRALAKDELPVDARLVRSDGTLCTADRWRAPDAVLSGPSTGPLAVAEIAAAAGFDQATGLDMGGTSTDLCHVRVGETAHRESVQVGRARVRRRAVAVEAIASGGGSIVSVRHGWLRVGPESAGANPGPQVYGRGGPPTVTDATVVAGLVDPLGFSPALQADRADLPAPAADVLDLAREAMAAAIRRAAAASGADPGAGPLVAFGGAAGQHACWVADKAGITTVLVHPLASVLCAWGQSLAREVESHFTAVWAPLPEVDLAGYAWALGAKLPDWSEPTWEVDLRSPGTEATLTVPWRPGDDHDAIARAFQAEHLRVFGFLRPGTPEVVHFRARVGRPSAQAVLGGWRQLDPWDLGDRGVVGPALLPGANTTVAVPSGWTARREAGLLRLERTVPLQVAPVALATWGLRLQAIAEEAGETLRRLARSVNIRDRLDYSCALFDSRGTLVANAPHVPVHLGAMGETVRDLLSSDADLSDGSAWLTNDPSAGGSHLPDLTVVTPVYHGGDRFFVACRGHHADVGGVTPGSMPPFAQNLAEEGLVFRRFPLLQGGCWNPDLREILSESRLPDVVMADLEAQVAANRTAAALLRQAGTAAHLNQAMSDLFHATRDAVVAALDRLEPGQAEDEIDGVPLRLAVYRERRWVFDFSGTGPPHRGNLNAPTSVVRAAVLYVVRVLSELDLPLHEGALDAVEIRVPQRSILAPPAGSAVAGGNVETSQRLVDLMMVATGRSAAGPGTMCNLTLGGAGWSYYETLGGGAGGSARGPGISGRQVHMTNTRLTDAEVLERRTPIRVVSTSLRRRSGGSGRFPGGDGLVRELRVTEPSQVSLLAAFRPAGAPGCAGGGRGAPGEAWLKTNNTWSRWDGATAHLATGDHVRVLTPGGGGWGRP